MDRDEEKLREAAANGDEGAQRELDEAYVAGQLTESAYESEGDLGYSQ